MPQSHTLSKPINFDALGPFGDPYIHLDPYASNKRHLYSASQFTDPKLLAAILDRADVIQRQLDQGKEINSPVRAQPDERNKAMYVLFVGSTSTRTVHATQRAATLLGMNVVADQSLKGSSMDKGESWEHTIMALSSMMPDVFAIRANDAQLVWRAMQVSSVPVINCGNGENGGHPTQMLGDIYLIRRRLGRLDNLRIVVVGDLRNSRVLRSNLELWGTLPGVSLQLFSPAELTLAPDIRNMLDKSGAAYEEHTDRTHLHDAMAQADVVYTMADVLYAQQKGTLKYRTEADLDDFVLDWKDADVMQPHAFIMNPLPTIGEIRPRLDFHPRSAYAPQPGVRDSNNQMTAGLVARMAGLEWVFGHIG